MCVRVCGEVRIGPHNWGRCRLRHVIWRGVALEMQHLNSAWHVLSPTPELRQMYTVITREGKSVALLCMATQDNITEHTWDELGLDAIKQPSTPSSQKPLSAVFYRQRSRLRRTQSAARLMLQTLHAAAAAAAEHCADQTKRAAGSALAVPCPAGAAQAPQAAPS